MSLRNIEVGVTDYTTLTFVDTTGTPVTGKVEGNFTIELSDSAGGNVATTGITLTEVDASNNAGDYRLAYNGATAFNAAAGYFKLVVKITVDSINYLWEDQVVVSTTNSIDSVVAAWIPTASDGRVVESGPTALANASVIYTVGGTHITTMTTDANGVHAVVYLPATAVGTVQLAGYDQGSFAVTVSGGVATGPGADVTLTAVSSTNTLTASDLWAYWKRMAEDRTGPNAARIALEGVNDALRMVAKNTKSSWWYKADNIEFEPAYDTGTLTVTSGSTAVSLSGGTFPSWAANGEVWFSGRMYSIASRTDGTNIVLDDEYVGDTESPTSGWTVALSSYTLNADMYEFHQLFEGNEWIWGQKAVSWQTMVSMRQNWQITESQVRAWTVAQGKLFVWPAPSANAMITYGYYGQPADLVNGNDTADIDSNIFDLLYRAIDYQVALKYGRTSAGTDVNVTRSAFDKTLKDQTLMQRNKHNTEQPLQARRMSPYGQRAPLNVPSGA